VPALVTDDDSLEILNCLFDDSTLRSLFSRHLHITEPFELLEDSVLFFAFATQNTFRKICSSPSLQFVIICPDPIPGEILVSVLYHPGMKTMITGVDNFSNFLPKGDRLFLTLGHLDLTKKILKNRRLTSKISSIVSSILPGELL